MKARALVPALLCLAGCGTEKTPTRILDEVRFDRFDIETFVPITPDVISHYRNVAPLYESSANRLLQDLENTGTPGRFDPEVTRLALTPHGGARFLVDQQGNVLRLGQTWKISADRLTDIKTLLLLKYDPRSTPRSYIPTTN